MRLQLRTRTRGCDRAMGVPGEPPAIMRRLCVLAGRMLVKMQERRVAECDQHSEANVHCQRSEHEVDILACNGCPVQYGYEYGYEYRVKPR